MSPEIATALGALATSAVLAASKQFDNAITSAPLFRKLQPAVTLVGSFFAAFLAGHGISDPATLTTAPLATVGTILVVEVMGLLKKKR